MKAITRILVVALIVLTSIAGNSQTQKLVQAEKYYTVRTVSLINGNNIYYQLEVYDQTRPGVVYGTMVYDQSKPKSSTNPYMLSKNRVSCIKMYNGKVFYSADNEGIMSFIDTLPMSSTNPKKIFTLDFNNGSNYDIFCIFDGKLIVNRFAETKYSYDDKTGETKEFFTASVSAGTYDGLHSGFDGLEFNGKFYFAASNYGNSKNLYIYDKKKPLKIDGIMGMGTHVDNSIDTTFNPYVVMLNTKGTITWSSRPQDFFIYKGNLYFEATDSAMFRTNLYKVDSSNNITMVLRDLFYGEIGNTGKPQDRLSAFSRQDRAIMNGIVYFPHYDKAHGTELWMYDGINAPKLCLDIVAGADSSKPRLFAMIGNTLTFTATVNKQAVKYAYDGKNLTEIDNFDINTDYTTYREMWLQSGVDSRVTDGEYLYYTQTAEYIKLWTGNTDDVTGYVYKFKLEPFLGDSNTVNVTLCAGTTKTFSETVYGDSKNVKYQWSLDGVVKSAEKTLVVDKGGVYTLVVTNNFGSVSKTYKVTDDVIPTFSIGEDTTVTTSADVRLAGPVGFIWYAWCDGENSISKGISNIATFSPKVASFGNHEITLTVSDANYCKATATMNIDNQYKSNVNLYDVMNGAEIVSVEIYSTNGVLVATDKDAVDELPNGIYLVRTKMSNGDVKVGKIVK